MTLIEEVEHHVHSSIPDALLEKRYRGTRLRTNMADSYTNVRQSRVRQIMENDVFAAINDRKME